jgi:S1-C subfamily serine protease
MSNLAAIYQNKVRPCVVAFVSRYVPVHDPARPPLFPPIIGTGFIVREDGIVATNAHVVEAFKHALRPSEAPADEWPVQALLFYLTDKGMVEVNLPVMGVFAITKFVPGEHYYGSIDGPDIAFVHVKARNLPVLDIDYETQLQEGMEVCMAGFPMGTDALTAPGWVHQITPTLQKGIVSAVLPFISKTPHAYSINVMAQGGASGSPVFLPETGKVIGALYAGLNDLDVMPDGKTVYRVPTAISYVVPAHYLASALKDFQANGNIPSFQDAMTIDEMIASRGTHNVFHGGRNWLIKPLDDAPPSGERAFRKLSASES